MFFLRIYDMDTAAAATEEAAVETTLLIVSAN